MALHRSGGVHVRGHERRHGPQVCVSAHLLCRHAGIGCIHGRTSLSQLGTDQANAPNFGVRPIVIHGPCQSGKSLEICLCAWLAYSVYETVPYIFVMNHGGLGIIPLIMSAVDRFNRIVDQHVKSVCGTFENIDLGRGWRVKNRKI